MVTEKGIVTRVDQQKHKAWVKTTRTAACEACAERNTCRSLGGGKDFEVCADNPLGAKEGDAVVIGFHTASLIKLSFMLYLFPVLVMIPLAYIGDFLGPVYGYNPSASGAILAFSGFIICFFIIRATGAKMAGNERYHARILRHQYLPKNADTG